MITIIGANGQFGRAVTTTLLRKQSSVEIRAIVSNEGSKSTLKKDFPAIEVVVGDVASAEDMNRCLSGSSKVYYVCPSLRDDEFELGSNIIEAAKTHSVSHFVMHSLPFPYIQDIPFHRNKSKVCLELLHSELPFTIIQPTNIMQNATWVLPTILEQGEFGFPYSADQTLTWLDIDDYAEATANVLLEPGHLYASYELASPDGPMTRHQMAKCFENELKRPVKAVTLAIDTVLQAERFQSLSDNQVASLKAMFDHYHHHGFRAGGSKTLEMLIGRKATTFQEAVVKMLRDYDNG